ncbi:MAG: twin-arginine translocase TatA/TatE family subunit [Alphaproteobacteria bacterium]|nr:twin-arginine translocase TatA/TatE family subunit [Alphaproteobacteria bacterium]
MRGGIWEIIIIVLLILILFGSAKIPAMMKNIAGGIKTFKKEIKEEPVKPAVKKAPVKKKAVAKKKAK